MPPTSPGPEVTLAPPARVQDAAAAALFGIAVAAARDPAVWQLASANGRLCLHAPSGLGGQVLDLDFSQRSVRHRLESARREDPLPRAVGLARGKAPIVLDATGGLCRDAAVLAHLGCSVTAIERVPALAFLAARAAERARLRGGLVVHCADAMTYLDRLPDAQRPEVVCVDPMFEEPGKAQVKLEMQLCRLLCTGSNDAIELLQLARRVAQQRVVVKRHGRAAPLLEDVSFAVAGERVRFDVYLPSS